MTLNRNSAQPEAVPRDTRGVQPRRSPLPAWPIIGTLVGYPLWWVLGPGEIVWWVSSALMLTLLLPRLPIALPRGAGIYALFLVWMLLAVIMIDTPGRLIGFVFRALFFITPFIVLVYSYNARERITERTVGLCATVMLAVMTVGALLGMAFPLFRMRTPMALLLPGSIESNDLVSEIVNRRLTQFEIGDYGQVDPRPSAPFLYTNDWGLVYTFVLPISVAYAISVRRERKVWLVLGLICASVAPALYTQNRGMLAGLALAAAYLGLRGLLAVNKYLIFIITAGLAVVSVAVALTPVLSRIQARQDRVNTTNARTRLYEETFQRALHSPLFGYGGPRPSTVPGAPASGTQGQVWGLMFDAGFVGLVLFVSFIVLLYIKTLRAMTPIGLAVNAAFFVAIPQMIVYDLEGTGMYLLMLGAGAVLGSRTTIPPPSRWAPTPAHVPAAG